MTIMTLWVLLSVAPLSPLVVVRSCFMDLGGGGLRGGRTHHLVWKVEIITTGQRMKREAVIQQQALNVIEKACVGSEIYHYTIMLHVSRPAEAESLIVFSASWFWPPGPPGHRYHEWLYTPNNTNIVPLHQY